MDRNTAELVIVGVSLLGSGFGMMALYSGVSAFISVLFFTSLINGLIVLGYLRSDDSDGSNDHENSRTGTSVRGLQKRFEYGDLTQEEFEDKIDEAVKGKKVTKKDENKHVALSIITIQKDISTVLKDSVEKESTQMKVSEFKSKVREAAETDKYVLRDSDGFIYWVDRVDMDAIYYHSGDETHRASWDQLHDQYSLVDSADLDLLR